MNQSNCWLKDQCSKVDCGKFCPRFYRLNRLYDSAFVTDQQRQHMNLKLDKDECDKYAFDKLHNIEQHINSFVSGGNNIYLYSTVTGNGKTSWALRLLQAYFNYSWPRKNSACLGLFISVPKYLLAIKDNITDKSDYIKHIKDNVYDCDIVIWDDIATKAATVFEHENLLSIIDTRIANGKTNIFTSNLGPDELHAYVGDRLFSRIYNNSDYIFEFKGKDKRRLNERKL